MFDSWKYSKGSYLVIILTASIGTFILGVAYHLRNFSEILSGVIGGLTIILGMLTAEWLRSSRKQIEETRTSYKSLILNFERLLYSYDELATDQYSPDHYIYWDQYERCADALMWLRGSVRWPQPNAKKIRLVAQDLSLRFEAMNADATENDYVWTMEERFELLAVLPQFRSLIWPRTPYQDDELRTRFEGYRKTPPNDRLPLSWKRKSKN
ncbi:MAG: hypothetical protein WC800_05845 [Candidatus Nanopelagicaceae bacterium]|jgi:hypothetical protein